MQHPRLEALLTARERIIEQIDAPKASASARERDANFFQLKISRDFKRTAVKRFRLTTSLVLLENFDFFII